MRSFTAPGSDYYDGVDVEYTDGLTWEKATVQCHIPGDVGSIELDALKSDYLGYCAVADDVPGYGQSAVLLGFEAMGGGMVRLESSEPMDWSSAGPHLIALRRPDGTLSGPYVATRVDDYALTIVAPDFIPDLSWEIESPHLLFGTAARWSYPVLITLIDPNGNVGARWPLSTTTSACTSTTTP